MAFGSQSSMWDEALLTQFLEKPRDVVKGKSMPVVGVKKPDDSMILSLTQSMWPL